MEALRERFRIVGRLLDPNPPKPLFQTFESKVMFSRRHVAELWNTQGSSGAR